jgi:hypothetical protein
LQLSRALHGATTLEAVLDRVRASITENTRYNRVYIHIFSEDQRSLEIVGWVLPNEEQVRQRLRTIDASRDPFIQRGFALTEPAVVSDAREDPDFMIVARSDAYWVSKDLDDTVARLNAYAEAGADMVFPTMPPPPVLAQVRARLTRPVMVVDSPGYKLADEAAAGAAIVLYYGFSLLVQFQAVQQALLAFRTSGDADAVPGLRENVAQFEDFIGYAEFTARTRKYGAG